MLLEDCERGVLFRREDLSALSFPLCFLFWMVPVPAVALNWMIPVLQKESASTTRVLFEIAGFPSHRMARCWTFPG